MSDSYILVAFMSDYIWFEMFEVGERDVHKEKLVVVFVSRVEWAKFTMDTCYKNGKAPE